MRHRPSPSCGWIAALHGLGLGSALCLTGCQIDVGGQTLPSPYYQKDDIQYFASGPKMPVSEEAAAQKAFSADQPRAAQQ